MNCKVSQLFGVGIDAEVTRVNMWIQMSIAKKNDGLSLRNLLNVLRSCDKGNSGSLDYEMFEKGLRSYG
jgi:hypothetical protein